MSRVTIIPLLLLAQAALAQATDPGDLVPVEQGVSDMNALGTSLRLQPVELGEGNSFQRLFGVAGRPDLLVRSQGGLYAVFEQSDYMTVTKGNRSRTYTVWPAGTIFHIGRPDFTDLRSVGIRHGPHATTLASPGLQPAERRGLDLPDARLQAPRLGQPLHARAEDTRASDARLEHPRVESTTDGRVRSGLPGFGSPDRSSSPARSPRAVPTAGHEANAPENGPTPAAPRPATGEPDAVPSADPAPEPPAPACPAA
ncbi:MAG: hypothetical protein ACO32J_05245 [Phycisphaerales bacterium]